MPNGGFESYSTCPWTVAQLDLTGNWVWVGGSTDYYNSCEPTNFVSVPTNKYGFQPSIEGSGYIGMNVMGLHEDTLAQWLREPAGTFLLDTMEIGTTYYVSFKVALTLNDFESCCASNKIGALFSTHPYTDCNGGNPAPINNFAHVYTDSIITDSLNWTRIYGSFVADSAYTFVSIGNFFDSSQIAYIDYYNNYPMTAAAYYYVDDVRVSMDSSYVLSKKEYNNPINAMEPFPNPSQGILWFRDKGIESFQLQVFDLSGRLLFSNPNFNSELLDLRFLDQGEYILSLRHKLTMYQCKLIITK